VAGASATLRYDPLGRLYEATGPSGTRLLYDGDDLVAEYNSSGRLLRRYVHGLGAGDDPQLWFEGSGWPTPRGAISTPTSAGRSPR
jgi:YD repeat-containing protein